jgi:hypothetical protein
MPKPGYVYLCILPDAILAQWKLFKVGHTTQECVTKRLYQYPAGTRLLWCCRVSDSQAAERACIEALGRHPRVRLERKFGIETFSGELQNIHAAVSDVCGRFLHVDGPEEHVANWLPREVDCSRDVEPELACSGLDPSIDSVDPMNAFLGTVCASFEGSAALRGLRFDWFSAYVRFMRWEHNSSRKAQNKFNSDMRVHPNVRACTVRGYRMFELDVSSFSAKLRRDFDVEPEALPGVCWEGIAPHRSRCTKR